MTGLFTITNALAGRLMRLVAVALGLDADWFDTMLEPNASTFAVNHYPPRDEAAGTDEPELLFAEHADGNTLTVLHQRGTYTGLQVQPLDEPDTWIGIPVVDNAFVINVGELMTRWTNDHWPSTRHRVLPAEGPAQPHHPHHVPHARPRRGSRPPGGLRRQGRPALPSGHAVRMGTRLHGPQQQAAGPGSSTPRSSSSSSRSNPDPNPNPRPPPAPRPAPPRVTSRRPWRRKIIPNVGWFHWRPAITFRSVGERRSRHGAPRAVVAHSSCPERPRLRLAAPVSPGCPVRPGRAAS